MGVPQSSDLDPGVSQSQFQDRCSNSSLNVLCHASSIRMIYISSTWSQFRRKNRDVRQSSGTGSLCRNNISRFLSEYSQGVTLVRFHPPVRQGQIANAFRHHSNSALISLAKKVYDHKVFWFASCMLCVT